MIHPFTSILSSDNKNDKNEDENTAEIDVERSAENDSLLVEFKEATEAKDKIRIHIFENMNERTTKD